MSNDQSRSDPAVRRPDHWEGFYKTTGPLAHPSQFAVFVCDYLEPGQNVIEFGCGNGRDALFFASQGYRTVGLDGSEHAIALCREKLAERRNLNVAFHRFHIRPDWTEDEVKAAADTVQSFADPKNPSAIYARFFLHAITPEEELGFLALLHLISRGDSLLAVEFRTHRDQYLKKETSPHYRRYINPSLFHSRLTQFRFEPIYFVEGFGLAKYKADDAHVARFIIKPLGKHK